MAPTYGVSPEVSWHPHEIFFAFLRDPSSVLFRLLFPITQNLLIASNVGPITDGFCHFVPA